MQGGGNNRLLSCPPNNNPDYEGGISMGCGNNGQAFSPQIFSNHPVVPASAPLECYGIGAYFNDNYTLGGDFWFTGDIGEVIIYNRSLTGTEQTQVTNYLTSRWLSSVTPPTCSITSPTSGTNFSAVSNVTINSTATAYGSATISNVKFYQGADAARHGHHLAVQLHLEQRRRRRLRADGHRHRQ